MKRKSSLLLLISVPFIIVGFVAHLFSQKLSSNDERLVLDSVFEKAHADVNTPYGEGCMEGAGCEGGAEGCGM